MAKGLFYWYFENKEAVFRELATTIRLSAAPPPAGRHDRRGARADHILQGAVASVQFMAAHAHFFSLLEVEARNVPDVVRRGTEQHIADVTALIEAGQADGTVTPATPSASLALAAVGMVGQFSHFHRTGRIDLPLDELGNVRRPPRRPHAGRQRGRRPHAIAALGTAPTDPLPAPPPAPAATA